MSLTAIAPFLVSDEVDDNWPAAMRAIFVSCFVFDARRVRRQDYLKILSGRIVTGFGTRAVMRNSLPVSWVLAHNIGVGLTHKEALGLECWLTNS
jgi:xanthine/uracil/vitamin C permease (AzgA family)